jgi:peptide chain release factor 1
VNPAHRKLSFKYAGRNESHCKKCGAIYEISFKEIVRKMLDKLQEILDKYNEITEKLSDPAVIANQNQYRELAKAHSSMNQLVSLIKRLQELENGVVDAQEMIKVEKDPDMQEFLRGELQSMREEKEKLDEEIKFLLVAKDPNDDKDIIIEIRAGAGGDEASLFAGDLFRMYSRYAEAHRWKTEMLSSSPNELGGFKEVIFEIRGDGAYSRFKFESGVHRVQRIPTTESGGRIHTSTITVAVMPEAEDIEVDIHPNDIRVDVFRSSGPGGQSVNTTDSAVRITYLPTGLVVSCQNEKSQLQNREQAMRILRARLYEQFLEEQQAELTATRRSQIGTGDRSERIRTYNYPQGRVTDHRIGFTVHNLPAVLEGEIDDIIDALASADRAEKLKQVV